MRPEVEKLVTIANSPIDGTEPQEPPHLTFHLTDLGNAERLVTFHGQDLRYCQELGWLAFDGTRWMSDIGNVLVGRAAEETVKALYAEAATLTDKGAREGLIKHALQSESERRIQNMIAAAERGQGIPVRPDQLDADPWLLNCLNGTINLKTGELQEHRRSDLISKVIPVTYEPTAQCPRWEEFLHHIFDKDQKLIEFIRRAIGYSMTGLTIEHALFICYGLGRNGKSTLLSTLHALLGDYVQAASADLLLAKRTDGEEPHEVADLRGARFVWAMETEEGRRLAESRIKAITAGDPVKARRLYHDGFTFKPTAKVWVATNHKPVIRGTDSAIWERVKLIPFSITIPDEQQDKELPEKLLMELPGILAWAVRGCRDWQAGKGFDIPEAVRAATKDYRDEMDLLADFLTERCVEEAIETATISELYQAYVEWCENTGEAAMTKNLLTMKLKERGFVRRQSGRRAWWEGLRLRLPGEPETDSTMHPIEEEVDLRAS